MKQNTNIKYILLTIIVSILFVDSGFAQITKNDYFMETSYLRNSLNPALRPDQGYLVIPVLPNVGVNAQTNRFNLDNLTFQGVNGQRVTFMHQSVNADEFLSNLSNDNYLNTDVNIKLFGYGFYKGEGFWNIDLGVRTHMDANIPKSFFGLLKKGFQQDAQTPYDLSDLSATGYSFAELGVSHSRPFMDNNLMLGVRVKLLGGFADFNLEAQSLSIEAGPELWRAKSKVSLRGSAPGVTPKYNENGNFDGFDFDGFGMPGYGAGLDIGAVYQLKDIVPVLEGLKVSAALNDIGFIAWNKNNSVNLHSPETVVEVRPSQYENQNGSSLSDVLDNAFEDIKEAVNLKEDGRSGRTTALRMNMNLGAEYEIFKNKLSVGALYSKRFGNYFTTSEFIASVNARLCPWISTSLSYGVVHSKFDTFGLAIHLAPTKGLNLFIASDYAIPRVSSDFIPTTSKGVNAQFGISIPIGGKKSRAKETLTADDIEIKTFDKEIDVETKSIKEEIMSSDE